MFHELLDSHADIIAFYFPLGAIGLIRWGIWISKETISLFYRPKRNNYHSSVSIITPVYNEKPSVFREALNSWVLNKPTEIIAVIDHTDKRCISIFEDFAKRHSSFKLIITKKQGKRPALVDGIREARSNIVSLVDSDTIWEKDTLTNALPPFSDPKVGGVGTRQNVLAPKSLAQRLFNIQLDTRYLDEMPFLSVTSSVLTCLSGRTAFYRRTTLLPLLDKVLNETFQGKKVISGEDKRITYLVEKTGWKVTYQSNSRVYTHGVENLKTFFYQRIRWSRNSWRADLKALKDGWAFKHPFFAFHLIDKSVQPFTSILSPFYLFFSLLAGFWKGAILIIVWWHISRTIKILPHLLKNPKDILIIPFYIISSFSFGLTKIYAFFTMNSQGWITRWDAGRLSQITFFQKAPAYTATLTVFLILGGITASFNQYVFIPHSLSITARQSLSLINKEELALQSPNVLGAQTSTAISKKQKITFYEVKKGDTLSGIGKQFNISLPRLISVNETILPNWNKLKNNMILVVPSSEITITPTAQYNYKQKNLPALSIKYDKNSNTTSIEGRGIQVTLSKIRKNVGKDYIKEVSSKKWLISSNILIKKGVTLTITKNEATEVRLLSNKEKSVNITLENAVLAISGVKITSWNDSLQNVDSITTDGRSFIETKYSSLINITDSEFAYLGFPPSKNKDGSHGVSFQVPIKSQNKYFLTGQIKKTQFHNNYFGLYASGATGLYMMENKLYQNTHGLQIDNSQYSFLENNSIYDNKNFGILISDGSTKNFLEENSISNNNEGISISNSDQNTLTKNKIFDNTLGFRLSKSEANNILFNTIANNKRYGIFITEGATNNSIGENEISKNEIAINIQSNNNTLYKNTILKNRTGVYFSMNASDNKLIDNNIEENKLYAIFTKTSAGKINFLATN